MMFSLPMLIPMVIGVIGGILSHYVFVIIRIRAAARQATVRDEQRELSVTAYHADRNALRGLDKQTDADVGQEALAGYISMLNSLLMGCGAPQGKSQLAHT